MPFINDRLEANKESIARSAAAINPARASRFTFDPDAVVALLRTRIVGQDPIIAAMDDMLHAVKADIGNDQRPLAVNLFLGPTGSGKTETVRVIAEAIHGSPARLCRIDMNTLAQEHYAASLTGAPPGYVGSKEGTTLLDVDAIQGSFSKPGIVLFDELEKASTEVIRALLNVLDSGRLMLAAGSREIDFRNSLVFMTSNVGARESAAYRARFQRGWRRWLGLAPRRENAVIDKSLHGRFDPEFLNRIDRILPFERLNEQFLPALFDIELDKLQQRLQRRSITLHVEEAVKLHLCRQLDRRFGARDLARRVRTEFEPVLARALLDAPEADVMVARLRNARLQVIPES